MKKVSYGVLGDVIVDVTQFSGKRESKLRLGGIVHCARGFWALDLDYNIYTICPSYLSYSVEDYLKKHGASSVVSIGNVSGAPYVFLIDEAKEIGNQGYDFLLRDEITIDYGFPDSEIIVDDLLLISGNYDFSLVSKSISNQTRVHIDIANNVKDAHYLRALGRKFETVFVSTSSELFQTYFKGDFEEFVAHFKSYTKRLILKENRGGSRGYDFKSKSISYSYSQTQPIVHSVGVGDVYDTSYISKYKELNFSQSMNFASWIASEYAVTTFPDDFKKFTKRIQSSLQNILSIKGVSLPWEKRSTINIYIAAPDFDFIDSTLIDKVEESLKYHNFSPRRPVIENGQMESGASLERKRELYEKDLALLEECEIVIAILLYNDPGTLVEIGLSKAMGKPVLLFDPYSKADNCMLSQTPDLVTDDLDEILTEVFSIASNL